MNFKKIFLFGSLLINMNIGYAVEELQHFDDEIINELKDKIVNSRSFSTGDLVFIGNDRVNESTMIQYKNYYVNLKQVRWEIPKDENIPVRILIKLMIESKNDHILDSLNYITSCKSNMGTESIYSFEIYHPKVIYTDKTIHQALLSPDLKDSAIHTIIPSTLGLICITAESQNLKNKEKQLDEQIVKLLLEKN